MHYLLFIPNESAPAATAPQQQLEELGLADLVAGHEAMDNRQGPAGSQHGSFFAWRRKGQNAPFHYNASEQTWIPAPKMGEIDAGRYWVGFWNDSPPTPEDLQRPYSQRGETVELGDGNTWRFPVLQSLPHDLIWSDDGTWKFELQRQYHDLWVEADEILKSTLKNETQDFVKLAEFAVRCLKQNYRLLPEVVSHLRLFNTENIQRAIAALLSLEIAE